MLPVNLFEYEQLAQQRIHPGAWAFYSSGVGDEETLRANREAFQRLWLRPRVLVDVSSIDVRTTVLGIPVSMPILIAPTSYQRLAHPEGERATARAAGKAGTLMIASTTSTHRMEDIAEAASGPLWFQLYYYPQHAERLIRRAEAAGYKALVVTVDAPRWGYKEREERANFTLPPHITEANFSEDDPETGYAEVTWEAVSWLRSFTSLPLILKGILTAEDARLAVEHGIDAIVVSNHGGRQLDSVPATIEALPEIAEAVAGRCEIYLDGGIRRGTDVLKALALGARAVLIGRPVLWGLAANGAEGVEHVLELLRKELELAMALAGRPTLASIDSSLVRPASF
ncbi:MAG TPA: alpha-hydroxy acid oxidase [Ktedonobacteraceae bacterium]|nr:alpha-hydroxy acid oxidase [Ktedonobacteraceae bacterium]